MVIKALYLFRTRYTFNKGKKIAIITNEGKLHNMATNSINAKTSKPSICENWIPIKTTQVAKNTVQIQILKARIMGCKYFFILKVLCISKYMDKKNHFVALIIFSSASK